MLARWALSAWMTRQAAGGRAWLLLTYSGSSYRTLPQRSISGRKDILLLSLSRRCNFNMTMLT